MGRKQKLRLEKKAKMKINNEESVAVSSLSSTLSTGTETTTTTTTSTANANANANVYYATTKKAASPSATGTGIGSTSAAANTNASADTNRDEDEDEDTNADMGLDYAFPKSEDYIVAEKLILENNLDQMKIQIPHRCVHLMLLLGKYFVHNGNLHSAYSWFLDGFLHGSINCCVALSTNIIAKIKSYSAEALTMYFVKIFEIYKEMSGFGFSDRKLLVKELTGNINRKCAICSKTDTVTVTLRQYMGCNTYCYCGKDCQTYHWEEGNHKNECRHLMILNKYHKPYEKEIRDTAIRGGTHPALKKLRTKLGLTRPTDEDEGKPINPGCEFLIARDDGTVRVGTTPNPIGSSSNSS